MEWRGHVVRMEIFMGNVLELREHSCIITIFFFFLWYWGWKLAPGVCARHNVSPTGLHSSPE